MDKTRRLTGGEPLGGVGMRSVPASPRSPRGGDVQHATGRVVARPGRAGLLVRAYLCETAVSRSVNWEDGFDEQYITGRLLGKGSFGEVFLAVDRYTGQKVAVKDMCATRGRLTPERTLQKITKEVVAMKAIQACPTVVDLLGTFRQGDRYRIVMEHCGGGDLKYHLKNGGAFSEAQAALVAYEILKVIRACHDRDIVHGDVKTANFVLKSSHVNPFSKETAPCVLKKGWMKAIDFGCSQFVDDFTRMRSRVGTPVFMSPEVFQRNYSFESDLWSLGILLYHLQAGRFPFWSSEEAGSVSTVHDVMAAVNAKEPDFGYGPWKQMSADGLDFMQGLLDKNYLSRMTAEEAFSHPWITRNIRQDSHGDVMLNNIVPAGTVLGDNSAPTPDLAVPQPELVAPASDLVVPS